MKLLNKFLKTSLFSISLLMTGIIGMTQVSALEILATNYSMNATSSKMTAQELCTTANLISTDPTDGVTWECSSANLNTTVAGRYSINVRATDGTDTVLKTIQVKVKANVTNTAPTISLTSSSITIYKGDNINLASYVASAVDNEDGSLTPVITGTVDTSKAGIYSVTYTVTDKGGLKSSAKLTVKVIVKSSGSDDSATLTVENNSDEQSSTTVKTSVEDGTELPSTSDTATKTAGIVLVSSGLIGALALRKKRELND